VQLEPLHEIITLLMMPKKLIVSSEELRHEVIPRLNSLQIKQVLAMYTPTGTPSLSRVSSCACRRAGVVVRVRSGECGHARAVVE
jgi:hypothetical protein